MLLVINAADAAADQRDRRRGRPRLPRRRLLDRAVRLDRDLARLAGPGGAAARPATAGAERCRCPHRRGTPYRIGFVCLGNICRSPMADVVLRQLVDDAGLAAKVEVTSCGTGGWHLGEPMDPRAGARSCWPRGTTPRRHRAQQFDATWLDRDLAARHGRREPRRHHRRARARRAGAAVPLLRPAGRPDAGPPTSTSPTPTTAATTASPRCIAIVERTCRRLLDRAEALLRTADRGCSGAAPMSSRPPARSVTTVPRVGPAKEHP